MRATETQHALLQPEGLNLRLAIYIVTAVLNCATKPWLPQLFNNWPPWHKDIQDGWRSFISINAYEQSSFWFCFYLFFLIWTWNDDSVISLQREDQTSIGFSLTIKGSSAGLKYYTIPCHSIFSSFSSPSFPVYCWDSYYKTLFTKWMLFSLQLRCLWSQHDVKGFLHFSPFAMWVTGRRHCGVSVPSLWGHTFRAPMKHKMHFLKSRNAILRGNLQRHACLPTHL